MPPSQTRRARGSKSPMCEDPNKKRRIGEDEHETNSNSAALAHESATALSPRPAAAGSQQPPALQQPRILIDPTSSYLDTVAILERLSESDLVLRYKEWRLNGSAHDTHCRVCGRKGRLESCATCRLAFHGNCKPQGWIRDSLARWFCPFCVRNKWHISPPHVTPPASPERPKCRLSRLGRGGSEGGAGSGIVRGEGAIAVASPGPPSLVRSPRSGSGVGGAGRAWAPRGSFGNEGAARRMSGAVTEDLLTPSSEDRNAHELVGNVGEEHNHPHQQQPPSVSEARESELRLPSIKHQEGDSTATTRRTRKSRFSSLSSEVDDAISIIYRELDSVQSLRKEIEQLSEEKERLMQGIKIRDHDILYLNRQLESRPPDAEVRRLKDDVKRFDGVVRDLREENASLKTNLRAAEESAAAANQTLNEWKKRLATLMQ